MSTTEKIIKFYEKYLIVLGCGGHMLFYLQAYKIFIHKTAYNISLTGFLFALSALLSWSIYGFLLKNTPLIIVNLFGTIGCLLVITSGLLYG